MEYFYFFLICLVNVISCSLFAYFGYKAGANTKTIVLNRNESVSTLRHYENDEPAEIVTPEMELEYENRVKRVNSNV